jgi:hypothetical protein
MKCVGRVVVRLLAGLPLHGQNPTAVWLYRPFLSCRGGGVRLLSGRIVRFCVLGR